MEKKITINEWREMKKNDPKGWVDPKVKDEDTARCFQSDNQQGVVSCRAYRYL